MIGLKRSCSAVLLGVACSVALSAASSARAQGDDAIQECAQAYEQAQVKRKAGELKAAQEELKTCVRDVCPDFVRTDCGQWLSEVTAEIPSVIFAAQDTRGKDLIDVMVYVDDQQVAESLDGRAVELDPGLHKITFEHAGKKVEQKLLVSQGEKNRVLRVEIRLPVDSDGDGLLDENDSCPNEAGPVENDGCPEVERKLPPADSGPNMMRIGAYASWGVGAAGLTVFTIYGLKGKQQEKDALSECEREEDGTPTCSEEREQALIDETDQTNLIANVGLGVGIAGAVAGTVLFFMSQDDTPAETPPEKEVRVDVSPIHGGGFFSVSGTF